ncbi:uncharacterized protein LOC130695654 [Daphnia carinata]|uniref:uncharacterized protein LOC130695654 n=1 Tax=Daphnia carinata TaxID=120202 RepID=UPI00257FC340|nr:uncharacterized protein LOC130695654 [Daphnia carinata]
MADATNLNDAPFDYERTKKTINKIKNRSSGLSSTSEKSGTASRTAFQRTRYATAEDERVYKTYSTGTAAQQVKYDGHELRLIEDEESDCDQPSTSESVNGLSVNIVRLKPRAIRKDYKKREGHTKSLSSDVRHRPINDSEESVAKANAEVMQIVRLKEQKATNTRQFSPQRKS